MPAFGRRLVSKPAQGISFPAENAWWKMDEGSGLTAFDSSGNGYDGSLLDGAVFGGDHVIVGGVNPADRIAFDKGCSVAGATAVTITAEFYFIDSSTDRSFVWSEDTSSKGYGRFSLRSNSSSKMEFLIRDSTRDPQGSAILIEHSQVISSGTWYFAAIRMDSVTKTTSVWIDDDKQGLTGLTLGAMSVTTPFDVYSGDYADTNNNRRRTRIRNVRQYLTALTDQQIDDIRLGNV